MPILDRLRTQAHRLQPDPELPVDLLDILQGNIEAGTLEAIEADKVLDAALTAAEGEANAETHAAIRQFAARLPVDDPLRQAIENVSGGP